MHRNSRIHLGVLFALVALTPLVFVGCSRGDDRPYAASATAAQVDKQVDWSPAQTIAVQNDGRLKTLDSFARESLSEMTGQEHFPGLSPLASMFEWLFNIRAYKDTPLIYIKDKGMRIHLSAHMSKAQRDRIVSKGLMTPLELVDPTVTARIKELEPRNIMRTAVRRVQNAQSVARFMNNMVRIVPVPDGKNEDQWYTPEEITSTLPDEVMKMAGLDRASVERRFGPPVAGITPKQAVTVFNGWKSLESAWRAGDAEKVQSNITRLADVLPAIAGNGVYPSKSQLAAEARYYGMHKFAYGYLLYFLGALFAIPAFVTGWKAPRSISMFILLVAMVFHGYGIGLRWFILGRIPVANMFEAVVSSALVGVALGLIAEWVYRTGVFLIAANLTGFLALVLGAHVIPGKGTLTNMMGILDDVMLRIHTVLIISSYALIFLASVIAIVYLFGYYHARHPARSTEVGITVLLGGIVLWIAASSGWVYQVSADNASGLVHHDMAGPIFGSVAAIAAIGLCLIPVLPMSARFMLASPLAIVFLISATLAFTPRGFAEGLAWSMMGGGLAWAGSNLLGMAFGKQLAFGPKASLAVAGGAPAGNLSFQRPIMAGGAPGDEGQGNKLPGWLHDCDWSHLIILNMVFIMLFVGVILGAVWADYSWGRPWGWDPKEVFALNTWLIYAVLIHIRFVAKERGLWTAWLSVAGCLMMAFNWCFVNFFIVGLHSYA
jgi:ABC-type transport system involved in cytochrome c biogenesis permease subunit